MEDELNAGSAEAGQDNAPPQNEPTSVADAALSALGMEEGIESATGVVESPSGEVIEPVKAEGKPDPKADAAAKQAEEKKADPKVITDEDLIRPDNLSHKARDRFEKLVTGYKTEKTRAETAEAELAQHRDSFKALQDLGFSDEASGRDLVEFAKFRHALATNPQQALQTLQGMMRQIELQHGLRAQNTSALEAFPDLVERVNGEKLSYEDALEIARSRKAQSDQQAQNRQYEQRQRQDFQSQQTMQGAITRVEQMEAQWRATNPDYAAIHPHIQAEMQTIAQRFPPQLWPQQVELLYKSLSRAMTQVGRPQGMAQTPLRGNGHAASQAVPKSTAEAALLAMGMEP